MKLLLALIIATHIRNGYFLENISSYGINSGDMLQ